MKIRFRTTKHINRWAVHMVTPCIYVFYSKAGKLMWAGVEFFFIRWEVVIDW